MSTIVHDIVAGLLAGLLSVFLIVYAFQPNRPYPSWILEPADQPWIFLILIIAIVYLIRWDYMIGVLALLSLIAVVFDLIIFTNERVHPSKTSESLYTPSIGLIPDSIKEVFQNQYINPEVLPKEEQVSKQWTINYEPTPEEIKKNTFTYGNDINSQAIQSGLPLSDALLSNKDHYPMF